MESIYAVLYFYDNSGFDFDIYAAVITYDLEEAKAKYKEFESKDDVTVELVEFIVDEEGKELISPYINSPEKLNFDNYFDISMHRGVELKTIEHNGDDTLTDFELRDDDFDLD